MILRVSRHERRSPDEPAPFNDLTTAEALLAEHEDVAAIIIEPLQRIIPPQPGYLQGLRDLCDKHSVLLIFDEVVTGFRLAYGGTRTIWCDT